MKRFIVVILVIQLLFLSACSVPFFGSKSSRSSTSDDGQKMVQLSEDEAQVADRNNVADAGNGTGNEEIADAINESSAIQQNKTGVAGASTGIDTDDHDLRGESTEYGNTQTGDSENCVRVSDSENQEPAG